MAVIRDIMPAFELFQPAKIEDALALLDRYGSEAWVMAGGLDTFDWLKDRTKRPSVVVDLSQIAALRGIKEANGGLEIGATTPLTSTAISSSTCTGRSAPFSGPPCDGPLPRPSPSGNSRGGLVDGKGGCQLVDSSSR